MRFFRSKDGETGQSGESRDTEKQSKTLPRSRFNMHKVCGSFRKQRGAAAVEFAVVAPIFVLLLFGMVEYGRMVMVQQMLTNATREGARRAVLDGTTVTNVKTTVQDYLSSGNITVNDNEITVTPDPAAASFGDPVTVSLSVPFSRVSWLPAPMFLGNASMSATSVMRRESVQ
ncbi:MAG: TadE/TadG family type IV pilus assembly protein [Planctomycetota bacterium]|nr:TadE/TadG family type IV pilus assembly protein [Planctomycetota bacterium]